MASSTASVSHGIEGYMDDLLKKLVEKHVLEKARSLARAAWLPDAFVDGLKVIRTDKYEYHLINTFKGKWGEPLALWYEKGTVQNYPIRPKVEHPTPEGYTERDRARIYHGDDTTTQHPRGWHGSGTASGTSAGASSTPAYPPRTS